MKEIVSLIENNGLAITISAIVIFFAIKFGNLGFDYIKSKLSIKEHDKNFQLRTDIDEAVNGIVERAVLRLNACRVYVFEFGNGTDTIGGLPFRYMNCTYEALNQGARSEVDRRQHMSLSLLSKFIKKLIDDDYIVMDINNKTEDYSSYIWGIIEERKILKTIRIKIVDKKRNVIGYLGVDYCDGREMPDNETLDKYIQWVKEYALEIGAFLSVK